MPKWFALLFCVGVVAPVQAADQSTAPPLGLKLPLSWNYQTYDSNAPNAAGYGAPGLSHITLTGSEGDYRLMMVAPGLAICYSAPLKATVEQTETELVITTLPRMAGCTPVRFVIRADGSGGQRQQLAGGVWRWDRLNRVLTPRD